MSPLQRSMKQLREEGWHVEKVEWWNSWGKVRQDLFGILDLLCIHKQDGHTLGVQVTTMGQKQPHIRKIRKSKNYPLLRKAGWMIQLHSWRKLKKSGWTINVERL